MTDPPQSLACTFCGYYAEGQYQLLGTAWDICGTCRCIAAPGRLERDGRSQLERRVLRRAEMRGKRLTPGFRRKVTDTVNEFCDGLEASSRPGGKP